MLFLDNLSVELTKKNIFFSKEMLEKIKLYVELIENYNFHTNILGTNDLETIIYKHILDCALGFPYFPKGANVADIGAGAGFPGIVLGILGLGPIYLVESKSKKVKFLRQVLKELKLTNIFVYHQNVAQLSIKTDVITCRAFSVIEKVVRLTRKMRFPYTRYIFLQRH